MPKAPAYDASAQAYFTANSAYITSTADKNAINTFYLGCKSDGFYTKIKGMWLLNWGAAAGCKWNLVNPLDLDAAYRIVWNGGWVFSSSGATPNGVNAWANTFLVSQGTLGLNSTSFGVYSRTDVDRLAPSIGNVTGGATGEASLWLRYQNSLIARINTSAFINPANPDSRGLILVNRINSTQVTVQIRGTQTTFTNASQNTYTAPFQLGGVNPNFFDTKQQTFAYVSDGLTSTEMTNFQSRVQTLMTYFGIQV
jgi:hypothetical protein